MNLKDIWRYIWIPVVAILTFLLRNVIRKKATHVLQSIPADRIDKDGKLIPIGTADDKGMTQVSVAPIEDPGIFGDDTKVKFTPPGQTKPVEVALPTGVKAPDVEHVVVVKPDVWAVSVKDSSKVPASTVDELVKKFGGL